MGYERSIVLKKGEYPKAIQVLAEAFQLFSPQYAVETTSEGFLLIYPEDVKWPHRMQISIKAADRNDGNMPKDAEYLYFLSYLSGNEEYKATELITATLRNLGYEFELDDL
jgi:hypothetical protein